MSDHIPVAPPAPPPPPPPASAVSGDQDSTTRILAALGYIFGIVAIIVLLIEPYKNQRFSKFHAIQAIGLWVAGFALNLTSIVPLIGWITAIVGGLTVFVLAVISAINAFQGKWYKVPVVHGVVKGYIDR